MFVRNAWYVAAWADEVGASPVARRILDEPVVLFRTAAGDIAALEDRCSHRGTPLAFGRVVEAGLEYGYHGLVFDAGGRCVLVPGGHPVPPRAAVRSYPVIQRNQFVWIWMGEAQDIAGNPQTAMPLVEQAMILNPHYPPIYLFFLGHSYYLTQQYAQAIASPKQVVTLVPSLQPGHL